MQNLQVAAELTKEAAAAEASFEMFAGAMMMQVGVDIPIHVGAGHDASRRRPFLRDPARMPNYNLDCILDADAFWVQFEH